MTIDKKVPLSNASFMAGLDKVDSGAVGVEALIVKRDVAANKRYRLVIEEEENALNYVPVGVNGVVYQIMRGVEVEVPKAVIDVLDQAKASRVAQERLQDGSIRTYVKSFNRYPYRVIGEV